MTEPDRDAMPVWRMLKPVLALPGTVIVLVPAVLLWATDTLNGPAHPLALAVGGVCALVGVSVAAWTSRLFVTLGEGTPAPWDPPSKLVVDGPYRYVRNPMISAVMLVLLAEALLFGSWPIAYWLMIFAIANMIYFPLFEEPGLEKRFGEAYRRYKANVPRWFPRLTPWSPYNREPL
jgi:protein-S-isoprenylcysteine O-methyltransferase Ste14